MSVRKIDFMHNNWIMHEVSENTTISELAFQALRQDVLSGRHAPEAKLKMESLQSLYGFSSSPLREALNRLALASQTGGWIHYR